MAVREAVANAVTHGNVYSADKRVHFSVELDEGRLVVRVKDEGTGFDLSDVPDPPLVENILKASRRGLLMMRALVDEVELHKLSPSSTEAVLILLGPTRTEDKGKEN
jgi:serine/threonine-protein kinase RsbW